MPIRTEFAGLPFREALAYFAGKTNIPTQRWTDVWRTGHAFGFMVAGASSDALLSDLRSGVQDALNGDIGLGGFVREFRQTVARHGWEHNGEPAWRARIIYETNLAMAHSAGRYAQLTDPDTLAVYPYWQYVHSGARHPRRQHQAWDGLILRADDPWWGTHYPPNGWRCGCRVRPVSQANLARMGRSGPDKAPPIVTRPWRNPSTGQVEQVPAGIDPGFDYNPGAAWLRGAAPRTPAEARFVAEIPPAPPAPALPRPEGGVTPEQRRVARATALDKLRDQVLQLAREKGEDAAALRRIRAMGEGALRRKLAALGRA